MMIEMMMKIKMNITVLFCDPWPSSLHRFFVHRRPFRPRRSSRWVFRVKQNSRPDFAFEARLFARSSKVRLGIFQDGEASGCSPPSPGIPRRPPAGPWLAQLP